MNGDDPRIMFISAIARAWLDFSVDRSIFRYPGLHPSCPQRGETRAAGAGFREYKRLANRLLATDPKKSRNGRKAKCARSFNKQTISRTPRDEQSASFRWAHNHAHDVLGSAPFIGIFDRLMNPDWRLNTLAIFGTDPVWV
jgi:hypothetical protein